MHHFTMRCVSKISSGHTCCYIFDLGLNKELKYGEFVREIFSPHSVQTKRYAFTTTKARILYLPALSMFMVTSDTP